ncbi:hypothetical protein [uncultured Alistipes sp.]|jgi:hypothetical protein|uniref:hypothetical protein n=1 Tax=uncultured Alistipes sp. TaxID=538949 RepID=UPI0025CF4DB3|nr:hypothetical protein [uncultured Alistipes sp.]
MSREDLHDVFIGELYRKVPKKVDLVNLITDILKLEKESVYRRLAGKVSFSVREIGILSKALHISLDSLLRRDEKLDWLPFVLEYPLNYNSIDTFYDMIEYNIKRIREITRDHPGETGNVYNSLPMEFFVSFPLILRFMFFKWGNYFAQSEEFNTFSGWELPQRLSAILESYYDVYNFQQAFYVWDSTMIWSMAREIENFHRMHVITTEEKEAIKTELKQLLTKLEQVLNGTESPNLPMAPETDFYVSSINVGFSCGYYASQAGHFAMLQTNFSYSKIENSEESFSRIKDWIKSFCNISTLLSNSGRIERRLFFENQHKIIEHIL